jgi:succinyl-CoA synthetase beta subunit
MLNHKLVTKQTSKDGVLVQKVIFLASNFMITKFYFFLKLMVAEALDISRETYFAIVLDRDHDGPVMVGSPVGGMDIEEVAENQPDKIFKVNTF